MATKQVQSMRSEVYICNQALNFLGKNQITSLDDPSKEAEWCRSNYPELRDALLEQELWSFALVRAKSTTADRDPWDQVYTHRIPADWLSVQRVFDSISDPRLMVPSEGWTREGEYILTKEPTIYLWGTNRITNTGQFSSLFVQALVAKVALAGCIKFTEKSEHLTRISQMYDMRLSEAINADALQGDRMIMAPSKYQPGSLTGFRRI